MVGRRRKRTYGTGALTKLGPTSWRIRWREGDRRLSATYETEEEAQAALARRLMRLARELRPHAS